MDELINEYLNELYNISEFKRLIELKNLIDIKYKNEIISLKTNESLYNEALKYSNYYPNIDNLKNNYIKSKANLYSKDEVKEYFDLERKINEYINNDIDDIKKNISNKFKTHKLFSCH